MSGYLCELWFFKWLDAHTVGFEPYAIIGEWIIWFGGIALAVSAFIPKARPFLIKRPVSLMLMFIALMYPSFSSVAHNDPYSGYRLILSVALLIAATATKTWSNRYASSQSKSDGA